MLASLAKDRQHCSQTLHVSAACMYMGTILCFIAAAGNARGALGAQLYATCGPTAVLQAAFMSVSSEPQPVLYPLLLPLPLLQVYCWQQRRLSGWCEGGGVPHSSSSSGSSTSRVMGATGAAAGMWQLEVALAAPRMALTLSRGS